MLKKHNRGSLMGEESDILWGIVKTGFLIIGLDLPGQMGAMYSCWHHPLPEMTAWGVLKCLAWISRSELMGFPLLCPQRGFLLLWWCPKWMTIDGSAATEQCIWTNKLSLSFCDQGHIQWWGLVSEMASLVLHKGFFFFSLHCYKAVVLTIRSLQCPSSSHSEGCLCRGNASIDAEIKEVKRYL